MKTNLDPYRLSCVMRRLKLVLFLLASCMMLGGFELGEASAQTIDLMQPAPGERAGALGHGELLVSALRREKVESGSANRAVKSLSEVFPMRLCRSNDKYVIKVNSAHELTRLRYQRAQHIYETILTDNGTYESRLLADPTLAAPQDMIIDPPTTEAIQAEPKPSPVLYQDQDTADEPIPDLVYPGDSMNPNRRGEDDVRLDEDDAPPDAQPQPIDAALAGKPNPDDLPTVPRNDAFEDDPDLPGPPIEDGTAHLQEAPANTMPSPTDAAWDIPKPSTPSSPANRIMPAPTAEPAIIPLPAVHPARPEPSHGYSPYSLALACLGLIALIASILLTLIPTWRARQHLSRAGLTIEDEIYIADGQRLAIVSDAKHHFLVAVSAANVRLLTCCDDEETALRAWAFFKRKTYWQQLADRPLSDKQLADLIQKFNETDTPDEEDVPTPTMVKPANTVSSTFKPRPIASTTPTLPAGMMSRLSDDRENTDDHETLEVPEMSDFWNKP